MCTLTILRLNEASPAHVPILPSITSGLCLPLSLSNNDKHKGQWWCTILNVCACKRACLPVLPLFIPINDLAFADRYIEIRNFWTAILPVLSVRRCQGAINTINSRHCGFDIEQIPKCIFQLRQASFKGNLPWPFNFCLKATQIPFSPHTCHDEQVRKKRKLKGWPSGGELQPQTVTQASGWNGNPCWKVPSKFKVDIL